MLQYLDVALLVISFIYKVRSACVMTDSTGCINGISYNLATEIVCGSETNQIYSKSEIGCCNQGYPFYRDSEFCCGTDYSKVYPFESGNCVQWSETDDDSLAYCWDCTDLPARDRFLEFVTSPNVENEEDVLRKDSRALLNSKTNTITEGPYDPPCTEKNTIYGCYNTFPYLLSDYYPCGDWLLDHNIYGCCDGQPFRISSQSCCYFNEAYVIKNSVSYCKCQSYKCKPTTIPTKIKQTKPPTANPTTSVPTVTFTPTFPPSEHPTHHPTVSLAPTEFKVTVSKASNISNNNYKILFTGIAIAILITVAVALLQCRASSLIKQRHHEVKKFDDL
jgi:hypothetical protein